MTKQELYEEISSRKTTLLEETKNLSDEELDFIIKFSKEQDIRDPWSCLKVNLDEFFYYAMLVETYFDKTPLVKQVHEENKDFFTIRDAGDINHLINDLDLMYIVLKAQESLGEVDLKDPNSIRSNIKLTAKYSRARYSEEKLDSLSNIITLKCMRPKEFDRVISLVAELRNFKLVVQEAKKYISENSGAKTMFEKQRIQTRVLKENMNDLYKYNNLGAKATDFYKRVEKIKKDYDDKREYEKQQISAYKNFKNNFEKLLTQDEIVDYNDLIQYFDEDLKIVVLTMIHEHNQKCHKKIQEDSAADDENIRYGTLLNEFGIARSEYTYEELSDLPFDTIKELLTKLTDLGIKQPSILLEIIKCASKKSIDNLSKYIKKGIIKKDFIENNPTVFDISSDIYNNAVTNITSTINSNIPLNYIIENQESLLIPAQNFCESINTLTEYNLKSKITTKTSSNVLGEKSLAEKLDTIIELGYENALKINLNLAAYPTSAWKKVELLRQMGFEVDEEQLDTILQSKHFIVGQEEIENYIVRPITSDINTQLNNAPVPDVSVSNPLEIYSASELSYIIGTVIVSRPKVIRNLKKLSTSKISNEEKMLLSVANNMSLTHDEYTKVKQAIGIKTTLSN